MKPGMMRWKVRPSKNGVGLVRPASSRYSCSPVARPTKFLTVFGAWSGNSVTLMSPWLVLRVTSMALILPRRPSEGRSQAPRWLAHQPKQGRMGEERRPTFRMTTVCTTREARVFRTKSKSEQAADAVSATASSAAHTAADYAATLKERVTPAAEVARERAGQAKDWSKPHVEAARDWAKPHVDHGIEVAAPKLQGAVEGLAPKVDTARDTIVDTLLPKVAEAIAAVAAASAAAKSTATEVAGETADRSGGAFAVLKGDAVAKKSGRKGKFLIGLGVLAALGAAFAAFRKSAPREDPWATPLDDPYTAPSSGRASTTGEKVSHLADVAKDKAAGAAEVVKDKASDAKDKAASVAADAKDKATSQGKHAAGAAADATADAADAVADQAEDTKDKLD